MLFDESKFKTKKELFQFLVENKEKLIATKKAMYKTADAFIYSPTIVREIPIGANKANEPVDITDLTELNVLVAINTTNYMDSHNDVHLPGIWDKSLSENKTILHLQEHQMKFDKIISDGKDLKAYAKMYSWRELGFNYDGETQALVFDSLIKKSRNQFMFEQYGKGYVRNHSVGMRYIQLVLAVNDPDWGAEYEAWQKYFPLIVNSEVAENKGYFWAVKEAKVIEGSAVPIGSNDTTPTIENNKEPLFNTPEKITEPGNTTLDFSKLSKNFKL